MMTLFFGHPDLTIRYTHTRNGSRFCILRNGGRAAAAAEVTALRQALRAGLARIGAA